METSIIEHSDYTQPESTGNEPKKSNKETCDRIVVFMDIMGFKDMVARKHESSIIKKLEDLTSFISTLTENKDILFHTLKKMSYSMVSSFTTR